MGNLKGKVAIITGTAAKKSMGRGIALQLASEGANLVIVDKFAVPKTIWPEDADWNGLEDLVKEIEALGSLALPVEADVSIEDDANGIVSKTLKKFGKLDFLVHCVGVRGPVPVPVVELDLDTWNMLINVNLTGAFLMSRAAARAMIPDGMGKKIIMISSMAGLVAFPGGAGYNASKHGLLGLTKCLAAELGRYKINVNAICPGAFDTNFRDETLQDLAKSKGISVENVINNLGKPPFEIWLGRNGTPEDVAGLVSFLVSEKSNYITGQAIVINGGGNG